MINALVLTGLATFLVVGYAEAITGLWTKTRPKYWSKTFFEK